MRTPSMGLDQNQDGKFIDRYWGRIPVVLHSIPEADIYEFNEEYADLFWGVMSGKIDEENLSEELAREVNILIDLIDVPPENRTELQNKFFEYVELHQPDDTEVFDLLYFADEMDSTVANPNGTNSRVLGMNVKTMTLDNEIKLKPYSHAGSCDRAGLTNKMYVRTATTHYDPARYLGIVDLVTGQWVGEISMNFKPRSSGAFNSHLNMHAISTKEFPWIHLIDVATDTIVFSDGRSVGVPHGNDGGNATGHSVWLDKDHVALLDRHTPSFHIYKVTGSGATTSVVKTQEILLDTGCHSLRSQNPSQMIDDDIFFAAIEGESGTSFNPEMKKYQFDSDNGTLTEIGSVLFQSYIGSFGTNDAIHHFGCGTYNGKDIIVVPLTKSNRVFVIDVETWTLDSNLTPPPHGYYELAGGDPVSAGHADFCSNGGLNLVVITNHKGNVVSVIDLDSKTSKDIAIPSLQHYTNGTSFSQSHANKVIGTNYYFFEAVNGIFYEIDLIKQEINRSFVTGGKPVQSTS